MEIIEKINWVDILVIILMIRMSYVAFTGGLSHEIFPLIGSVISITFTLHYYTRIGNLISGKLINIPLDLSNFLGFLILVIIIGLILKILKALLDLIIKVEWHPLLERFGGLVIGIFRASIITSLILILLALAPLPYLQRSIREKSLTGMYFLKIGPEIYTRVMKYRPSINREEFINNLASDKSIAPKKAQKPH